MTGEQVAQRSLVDVRLPGQLPTCPAAEDSLTIDCCDVDGPLRRPSQSDMLRRRLPTTTTAMEGTVLRVPCIPSSRLRGFWRSSVRSAGPPGLNLGCGCRPLVAARCALSDGCVSPMAPLSHRPDRAARRAPECAHALTVHAYSAQRRRLRHGRAARRRRAGATSGSAISVKLIADNQARVTGTFQPR